MELIVHRPPIPIDDLYKIAGILRNRDVFTPGFDQLDGDAYDPKTYFTQKEANNTKTVLLADRNLFTRWVDLGKSCRITDEHRIAAATLCFCQCCEILIEPNIALYEVAADSGNVIANQEESIFKAVDNSNPKILADFALNRNTKYSEPIANANKLFPEKSINFRTSLRMWNRNYVLALKTASFALQGGKSHKLIERLFEWMHTQFLFLAPGTLLALYYFSPGGPKRGLFKQIQSKDRERALSGIKNAAWDMTLVHQWFKMVNDQNSNNTLNLLGSLDKKLNKIARGIFSFTDSEKVAESRRLELFENIWGNETSKKLYQKIHNYYKNSDDPNRLCNRIDEQPSIDELIAIGEQEIREWTPKQANG
jgi:hypothetical protein